VLLGIVGTAVGVIVGSANHWVEVPAHWLVEGTEGLCGTAVRDGIEDRIAIAPGGRVAFARGSCQPNARSSSSPTSGRLP
jgi:hypothetical protein